MDPSAEMRERDALLERIAAYVNEHGIIALDLDALAASLNMTTSHLREFFDTKHDIVVALMSKNRVGHREALAAAAADPASTLLQRSRALWSFIANHESELRLFFEAFGISMHDATYGDFVHGVDDWIDLGKEALIKRGVSPDRIDPLATLTLAVFRGAMLDLCATGERARIKAAMELWFEIITTIDNT